LQGFLFKNHQRKILLGLAEQVKGLFEARALEVHFVSGISGGVVKLLSISGA
jgi:hypothetical protein